MKRVIKVETDQNCTFDSLYFTVTGNNNNGIIITSDEVAGFSPEENSSLSF